MVKRFITYVLYFGFAMCLNCIEVTYWNCSSAAATAIFIGRASAYSEYLPLLHFIQYLKCVFYVGVDLISLLLFFFCALVPLFVVHFRAVAKSVQLIFVCDIRIERKYTSVIKWFLPTNRRVTIAPKIFQRVCRAWEILLLLECFWLLGCEYVFISHYIAPIAFDSVTLLTSLPTFLFVFISLVSNKSKKAQN